MEISQKETFLEIRKFVFIKLPLVNGVNLPDNKLRKVVGFLLAKLLNVGVLRELLNSPLLETLLAGILSFFLFRVT